MNRKLPGSLTGAFVAGLVLAVFIGCCSAYSSIGLAAYITMGAQREQLSSPDPGREDAEHLVRTMMRIQGAQVAFLVLTAIALGAGCGLGLSGRRLGRPLALGAFAITGLGVLADAGVVVWSWTLLRGVAPMADEEAMFSVVMIVSILPSALWMLLRLAIAGGGAAALFSASAREFYANVAPEGVRGPRE